MKRARFNYKKEDGSTSERMIINPSFLKESTNSLKDFHKPDVKYVSGIEISSEGLTESQKLEYQKAVTEYYSEINRTLYQFLEEKGLNPKAVTQKSFKKEGISELLIEDLDV